MVSRFVAFLLSWASGRGALIAFVLLIAGSLLLFRFAPYPEIKSAVAGAPLPEEGASYEGGLVSFLEELGEHGRPLYLEFQYWDLLNPVLFGAAFTLLIGWLVKRSRLERNWSRYAVLVPLAVAAADIAENLVLIEALAAFPGPGAVSALVAPVTAVKFLGFAIMMVAVVVLAVAAIIRRHMPQAPLLGALAAALICAPPGLSAAPTFKPPAPVMKPFAPLFEKLAAAEQARVSTVCGSGVAPWAYRGRTHGRKSTLRSYVIEKADRTWTASFVRLLMRESDWDSTGSCRTSRKPCDERLEVPLFVVELQAGGPIYALLDFEWRCAQVFRPDQPFGIVHFGERADSLFDLVRAALPSDTVLQALALPPEGSGTNLEGRLFGIDSVLVEELPEPKHRQAPSYPEVARKDGVQGTVVIQALVGRDGSVQDAFVVNSIVKLDDAALDAVWLWTFKPAMTAGEPIAVWVVIPVKFTLH